jgi:hypothetical protein
MSHVSLPARRVGAVPIGRTDSEPTTAFAEQFGGTLTSCVCHSTDVANSYSEPMNRTFVGRPGLDPGTLGLKGTCRWLFCVGLVAHVVCFQGIVLFCVGLVSWCWRNMRPTRTRLYSTCHVYVNGNSSPSSIRQSRFASV